MFDEVILEHPLAFPILDWIIESRAVEVIWKVVDWLGLTVDPLLEVLDLNLERFFWQEMIFRVAL